MEVPLKFDNSTLIGDFGHFACMLVDVDLSANFLDFVSLDVDGQDIEIGVHYQNLPLFCTACKIIENSLSSCHLVERQHNLTKKKEKVCVDAANDKSILEKKFKQVFALKKLMP